MAISNEEQQKLDQDKSNLINDLVAVSTIMEDYWRFHPANPNKLNIVEEHRQLEAIKEKIELDLKKLDA
jgi:hypothetical protein